MKANAELNVMLEELDGLIQRCRTTDDRAEYVAHLEQLREQLDRLGHEASAEELEYSRRVIEKLTHKILRPTQP